MKIKECCDDMTNALEEGEIGLSEGHNGILENTPCFWTGEEDYAHDVAIKFCPFCGKEIETKIKDLKNGRSSFCFKSDEIFRPVGDCSKCKKKTQFKKIKQTDYIILWRCTKCGRDKLIEEKPLVIIQDEAKLYL